MKILEKKFVTGDQILVKNKANHTLPKLVNVTLIFLSVFSMNSTIYFWIYYRVTLFKDWFRNNIILIYKNDFSLPPSFLSSNDGNNRALACHA